MRSVRNVAHPEDLPELGTKEAAVESCVSLIAGMCGQSEAIIHYWLDLYYQVRLAYEIENEQRRRREGVKLDAEQLNRVAEALHRATVRHTTTTGGDTQDAEKETPVPEAPAEGEAAAEAEVGEEAGAERSAPPPREPPVEL